MELCVCGKFADLECSECGKRGYCSVECQQGDWFKHVLICQEKKEERKRQKRSKSKKKKKKHKKHKKHKKAEPKVSPETTPNADICICGKEAEFECSRCEKQGYCSEDCQRKDWEVHWLLCEQVTSTRGEKREDDTDEGVDITVVEPVTVTIKESVPYNR